MASLYARGGVQDPELEKKKVGMERRFSPHSFRNLSTNPDTSESLHFYPQIHPLHLPTLSTIGKKDFPNLFLDLVLLIYDFFLDLVPNILQHERDFVV